MAGFGTDMTASVTTATREGAAGFHWRWQPIAYNLLQSCVSQHGLALHCCSQMYIDAWSKPILPLKSLDFPSTCA
jgi:hypothetical protein